MSSKHLIASPLALCVCSVFLVGLSTAGPLAPPPPSHASGARSNVVEISSPPTVRNADRAPERQPARLAEQEERERRREEWRKLSPAEREARIQEWRARWSTNRPNYKNLTPEEQEAKRQEMRERFQKQLKELRLKKAAGSLSKEEERRLSRMEEIRERVERSGPSAEGQSPRVGKDAGSAPAAPGRKQ